MGLAGKRAGLAGASLLFAACLLAEFPAERQYKVIDLAGGVFAFISPETSGPVPSGNVLTVVGDDGVLVVDSGRFPTLARRMIAEIRRRTDKPVRFLVHTHWHLDHIVGDSEFAKAFPGIRFLATDFTRRKMAEKQVPYVANIEKIDQGALQFLEERVRTRTGPDGLPAPEPLMAYLRSQIDDVRLEMSELPGAAVVVPDVAFSSAMTVHLGKREVRILFLGKGNTAGDTVIHVPDARVVATGDLLVAPVPYGYGCHPADWIETLKKLTAIDAAAIVPGHGPVMRDWEYAKKVSELLEAVRSQVRQAASEGADLQETRKRVDLSSWRKAFAGDDVNRGFAFNDFFARSAVERAWQEARGSMAEE
jgi:glyoxylase-like metal-dependent hydrolase (beta-lactamase superfamily II)